MGFLVMFTFQMDNIAIMGVVDIFWQYRLSLCSHPNKFSFIDPPKFQSSWHILINPNEPEQFNF